MTAEDVVIEDTGVYAAADLVACRCEGELQLKGGRP